MQSLEMKRAARRTPETARETQLSKHKYTPAPEDAQAPRLAIYALLAAAFRQVERASILAAKGSAPGHILGAVSTATASLESARWVLEFDRVLRKRGER